MKYHEDAYSTFLLGDVREELRSVATESIHTVVTSPPYWGLRDYGSEPRVWGGDPECSHVWADTACRSCGAWCGSLGFEPTPELYVEHLVQVFRAVRQVLRKDGTVWLVLGDSYAGSAQGWGKNRQWAGPKQATNRGSLNRPPDTIYQRPPGYISSLQPNGLKPKDLVGIPWRVALALQADGWWLRSDIIYSKPNPMPERVTDRPTTSHEHVFLLSKSKRYFYDADAIREDNSLGSLKRCKPGEAIPKHRKFGGSTRANPNFLDGQVFQANGRNARSVWTIPTAPFPGGHFATFPTALVERCIKAGTSKHGCCAECGAPWARVVEKTVHQNSREPAHVPDNSPTKTNSTGWAPTTAPTDRWLPVCKHDVPVVPCTVLDPFVGSGTTALVAKKLGCYCVGIDLSEEYLKMAVERCRQPSLGATRRAVKSG